MTRLPWRISGARLHLPRDLQIAYTVGRMGLVTVADSYALWYGSPHTARFGFGRLVRLGLLRSFPRVDPLAPAWYSLTPHGLEWTAEQSGCDEKELRAVSSIRHVNLPAVSMRNRLWVSLILSCRRGPGVRLLRFEPEWALRPRRPEKVHVVPDAIVVLALEEGTKRQEGAWIVEMDAGTQRAAVWKIKATQYAELRNTARLYEVHDWRLLAVVPSPRRARNVALAIVSGGAGAFSFVGVAAGLTEGRAIEKVLWSCQELARSDEAKPKMSLVDGLGRPISEPDHRGRATDDRGSRSRSGAMST